MAPSLPVSAVAARRMALQFPATVISQLQQIEAQLGGRAQVVGLLMLAPLTPDLEYLLGHLGDPRHDTETLAECCALANVYPADLLKLLSSAALLRGKVQAAQEIGAGIAAVARDVMRRAAPFDESCYVCRGTATVTPEPTPAVPNPLPGPCETCQGTGKLRYQPELDRQKLAIDMAHLLPKSGGIQIGLQQQVQAPAEPTTSRRARLSALTDQLLYGAARAPVLDGETRDVDPAVDPDADPDAGGEAGGEGRR